MRKQEWKKLLEEFWKGTGILKTIASVVLESANDSSNYHPKSHGYITGNKVGKRGGRYNERISKDGNSYRQYY